ncbi:MAG: CopD family protein, partial [Pseudomonadota bacterium]
MVETVETRSGQIARRRAGVALIVFVLATIAILAIAPDDLYLWIKAFHVIAVIAWMAGMLYLPRLFVYHADAQAGSEKSETFKIMERRLLRVIMNPAMIIVWVLGLWLAWYGNHYVEVW